MATSLGRTSLILASGTLVSRVLGFIKAIVLAGTIGLVGSASADAFANANSLPSNVYALISGGLLNAVLVPQIIRATKREDGGRVYVNRLLTLAITGLAGLTLILTIGAPVLAWIYGITLSPEQLGLVIAFAYWCIPQVFFYGLYAVLSEILNARSLFAPFASAAARPSASSCRRSCCSCS
jgi:putative peptidoglycan lipid II flippase